MRNAFFGTFFPDFPFLRDSSSPEEAVADVAALLARLDGPPFLPRFEEIKWLGKGVVGRELSGVGSGVASVDVPSL